MTISYTHIKEYILILLAAILFIIAVLLTPIKADAAIPTDVRKALKAGIEWRTSEKGEKALMDNVYSVYQDFGTWAWIYRGMRAPLMVAMKIKIESGGKIFGTTKDIKHAELGLMSIKRAVAQKYDLNACVPENNIWMGQMLFHERYARLLEIWPWLADESHEQQLLIAEVADSAGIGATIYLVNAATHQGKDHKDPYDKIVEYIRKKDNKLKQKEHWGNGTAQKVAFRVGLAKAFVDKSKKYQHGSLCEDASMYIMSAPKPTNITFPGAKLHRRCNLQDGHKEWKYMFPNKNDTLEWANQMTEMGCWPTDFHLE